MDKFLNSIKRAFDEYNVVRKANKEELVAVDFWMSPIYQFMELAEFTGDVEVLKLADELKDIDIETAYFLDDKKNGYIEGKVMIETRDKKVYEVIFYEIYDSVEDWYKPTFCINCLTTEIIKKVNVRPMVQHSFLGTMEDNVNAIIGNNNLQNIIQLLGVTIQDNKLTVDTNTVSNVLVDLYDKFNELMQA